MNTQPGLEFFFNYRISFKEGQWIGLVVDVGQNRFVRDKQQSKA